VGNTTEITASPKLRARFAVAASIMLALCGSAVQWQFLGDPYQHLSTIPEIQCNALLLFAYRQEPQRHGQYHKLL
jgi:hypothetical protein